jgi:predicted nucleic acid-binding protein
LVLKKGYIDANIIADWMLVKGISDEEVGKLRDSVIASHELIEHLFETEPFSAVISPWALAEAITSMKRSIISIKMIYANIPLVYYEDVSADPSFVINPKECKLFDDVVEDLMDRLSKCKSHILVESIEFESKSLSDLMLKYCLSADDALHLLLAQKYHCDFLITRDKHFTRIKNKLKNTIKILEPRTFFDDRGNFTLPQV